MVRFLLASILAASMSLSCCDQGQVYAREFQIDCPVGQPIPGDPWGGIGGNGSSSGQPPEVEDPRLPGGGTNCIVTAAICWGPIPNPFAIVTVVVERAGVILEVLEQRSARGK